MGGRSLYIAHADSMNLASTSPTSNPATSSRSIRRLSVKSARESLPPKSSRAAVDSSRICSMVSGGKSLGCLVSSMRRLSRRSAIETTPPPTTQPDPQETSVSQYYSLQRRVPRIYPETSHVTGNLPYIMQTIVLPLPLGRHPASQGSPTAFGCSLACDVPVSILPHPPYSSM